MRYEVFFTKSSVTRAVSTNFITGQIAVQIAVFFLNFASSSIPKNRLFSSCIISMIIIMRFLPFAFLTAILVAFAIFDDLLFSDDSFDMSTFQNTSQDLLTLQNLPKTSILIDGDDDLFSDSGLTDFSSSTDTFDLYSDPKVFCLIKDEQSMNKLRSRDGAAVCSIQDSTLLGLQRFRKAWEAIEKFRDDSWLSEDSLKPEPEKPPSSTSPIIGGQHSDDVRCSSDFSIHLCCGRRNAVNESVSPNIVPENNSVRIYFYCVDGRWIRFLFPSSFPSSSLFLFSVSPFRKHQMTIVLTFFRNSIVSFDWKIPCYQDLDVCCQSSRVDTFMFSTYLGERCFERVGPVESDEQFWSSPSW